MAKKASQKRAAAEPVEAAKPLKKAKDTQEKAATEDVKYVASSCVTCVSATSRLFPRLLAK